VKGPTEAFMRHAGQLLEPAALAELYGDVLHGIVADRDVPGSPLPVRVTDTILDDEDARRRVASLTLEFAAALLD